MAQEHGRRVMKEEGGRVVVAIAGCTWLVALVAIVLTAGPAWAVSGAGFTTFDASRGGCLDGQHPNGVNCDNYAGKGTVHASGGPSGGNGLSDGTYYFTVLAPAYQNGGFIDDAAGNLSDTTAGGTTGDNGSGDPIDNRTFTVLDRQIVSYTGTHATGTSPNDRFIIGLAPFDDTDNPGGVYILAVCPVGAISPSRCKYDAFRVTGENPPPAPLPLAVAKDASTSFDRTFPWSIKKDVNPTLVKQIGGGAATFTYTVAASHDSGTDSNWQVAGTITITNPNPVSNGASNAFGVEVTDEINYSVGADLVPDPNAACVVDTTIDPNVTEKSSVDLPYACAYSAAPAASSETNHVHVSWVLPASSIETADFFIQGLTFDTPNLIDACLNVTDSFAGSLGAVCVGDPNPKTFTYQRTVPVPRFDCVFYDNAVTFTTHDTFATGSDSKRVTVCGPARTGALTMGFWQNQNGQGIISSGASTAGACNSATRLRRYPPFQDLSATASCSQAATYVDSVIKAANASGASMNAMLRAQMLATALDVYFSDPALGGNTIKAPAPIGGVAIDLTKICKIIDSTGGTAVCSGNFENVSSAFAGETSLSVSQMLTFAASQSNAGGSLWFANVKTRQQLAKDAFDAVNNEVAFAP